MNELTLRALIELLNLYAGDIDTSEPSSDILDVPFELLGYDSLAMLSALGELEEAYHVKLGDSAMRDAQTPRQLLSMINERDSRTRGDVMTCIRSVWSTVLETTRIDHQDNFFDLGGDSYQATVVADRLTSELGVNVLRLDIYECPTVTSLTDRVTNEMAPGPGSADSGLTEHRETGHLLPHQHPHFKRVREIQRGFVCQLALRTTRSYPHQAIVAALDTVLRRHEAMRCRYFPREGSWRIATVEVDGESCVRFTAGPPPSGDEIERLAQSLRADMDPQRGRVLRAGIVDSGTQGMTFVLVAHHLSADTLSLEIFARELVESLAHGWGSEHDDPRPLPVSALDWAERVCGYAYSDESTRERRYWRELEPVAPFGLRRATPPDNPAQEQITVDIGEATVRRIRAAVPRVKASLNEILIGCVAQAYRELTDSPDVVVASVMSGREVYFDGFGPTRTVGWISYNVPYVIRFGASGTWPDLTSTVEQLRGIPNRGIANQIFECGDIGDPAVETRMRELRESCSLVVNFMADKTSPWDAHGWSMLPIPLPERVPYVRHIRALCLASAGGWSLQWDFNTSYVEPQSIKKLADVTVSRLEQLAT